MTSKQGESKEPTEAEQSVEFDEGDPWENFNRSVYAFNQKVDKALIKPAATGFSKLPGPVRSGVSNFFLNLFEPTTIVNDVLQGKIGQAIQDTTRFLLNTTVGVAGVFDVASKVDLPHHEEDFGQTLARWGVPDGPYMVLPILGPSNLRHTAGRLPYFFATDPVFYVDSLGTRLALRAVEVTDVRYRLLRTDRLLKMQLDPYIFLRESYWQRRDNMINDDAE